MAEYDTKAIRAAARQVKQFANGLAGQTGALKRIEGAIPGQLEGEMAKALDSSVQELRQEISQSNKIADVLYRELTAFADRIDALDRAASIFIRK